jgi:hypothetical protein
MSKKISFRGTLAPGLEDKINLKTIKGKVGYKIVKFELMLEQPGQVTGTIVGQIFKKSQDGSITANVNFTDPNLLAANYMVDASNVIYATSNVVIFDNEPVNQDIFINITDADGGTNPCNYYIELETMSLNDLEATQLTLKSIRTISS